MISPFIPKGDQSFYSKQNISITCLAEDLLIV